jgi:hypothetical protein
MLNGKQPGVKEARLRFDDAPKRAYREGEALLSRIRETSVVT